MQWPPTSPLGCVGRHHLEWLKMRESGFHSLESPVQWPRAVFHKPEQALPGERAPGGFLKLEIVAPPPEFQVL